jgi:hypothetical protein
MFSNKENNILFQDTSTFGASILLGKGHNDFYHTGASFLYDIAFNANFDYNSNNKIEAGHNWWEGDSLFTVAPQGYDYIDASDKDAAPNVSATIPENRFEEGLQDYNVGNYSRANGTFCDIISDRLTTEQEYWANCVDLAFATAVFGDLSIPHLIEFYQEQRELTPSEQKPYAYLMLNYVAKSYVYVQDYQSAVDILSLQISHPESVVDSLNAVIDLEIVYLLQQLENAKKPLTSIYQQYRYPEYATFTQKHDEHWNQLKNLLNANEAETFPIPPVATMYQNYPNPFNPSTTITFSVPQETKVKLKIYNLKGQLVRQLCDDTLPRGQHKLIWDSKDDYGKPTGSGLYLIRMETRDKIITRKAMMLK